MSPFAPVQCSGTVTRTSAPSLRSPGPVIPRTGRDRSEANREKEAEWMRPIFGDGIIDIYL